MGGSQDKCTVAVLNYSGIYLSPFQYYGIDNWQELEKIGRIFEQQLKAQYPNIKLECQKLDSNIHTQPEYERSSFKWNIGKIDKDIHNERYSPLYTSNENLKQGNFAGISRQNQKQTLMSQSQFFQKWSETFEGIKKYKSRYNKQVVKTCEQSANVQKYSCCMLDFLCYKSIILYLIANLNKQNQLFIDYRRSYVQNTFEAITQNRDFDRHEQIIRAYRKLMYTYFKRIDTKTKIQRTIQYFFGRRGPEIFVFAEATPELRIEIEKKNSQYYIFGPEEKTKVKQTLVLVKKSVPFKKHLDHQNQEADFNNFRNDLVRVMRNVKQKQNIPMLKIQFEKFIQFHFKGVTKDQLYKQLNLLEQDCKYTVEKLRQCFEKYMEDPIKGALQIQLTKFLPKLQEILMNKLKEEYKDKKGQLKEAFQYFDQLRKNGFMSWAKDVTFTHFQDERKAKTEVLFGGFHLASNPIKNYIQVQILGLIIYHLITNKKCKFIFAGDFNSYLSLTKRDNQVGMFQFVKANFKLTDKSLYSVIKTINIFPKHSKIITTKKKRTILQPQVTKANQMAEKCIDQILTNYPLKTNLSHVCEIEGMGSNKTENDNFLPHMQHPYDHYLVEASLDLFEEFP